MSGVGDLSVRYYPGAYDMINPIRHIPTTTVSEKGLARDCLVGLMGARLADRLLAQLYAAGFEIKPMTPNSG